VRLLRKLADALNGVDLSGHTVGDVIEMEPWAATILIMEGWAEIDDAGGVGLNGVPLP
jgi:hypothetical protein